MKNETPKKRTDTEWRKLVDELGETTAPEYAPMPRFTPALTPWNTRSRK